MNIVSRTLLLTLLVVVLGACEDPWDRLQGEPGEGGAPVETGESGPAEVTVGPDGEGVAGEAHEEEGSGAAEEGH